MAPTGNLLRVDPGILDRFRAPDGPYPFEGAAGVAEVLYLETAADAVMHALGIGMLDSDPDLPFVSGEDWSVGGGLTVGFPPDVVAAISARFVGFDIEMARANMEAPPTFFLLDSDLEYFVATAGAERARLVDAYARLALDVLALYRRAAAAGEAVVWTQS